MHLPPRLANLSPWVRVALIVALAVLAHLAVRLARAGVGRLLAAPRSGSRASTEATLAHRYPKFASVTSLLTSAFTFVVYFVALGLVAEEFGLKLTTYLASASVVGLALAFGSQGMVQDIVIGLTLLFSDAFDVGDMIEYASGQAGRVERIGLRFTVVSNFVGQTVYLPNRTIGSVSRYRHGRVRMYLDVQVPSGMEEAAVTRTVENILKGLRRQFGAIVLSEPEVLGVRDAEPGDWKYLRSSLRLWPGQQVVVEEAARRRVLAALRRQDADYAEWMISVTNRAG